ncbi:PTS sugar transporter [Salipaludibacillus neizhouensis]|uniref:PTS sugar transporter n=1 Tax=Salipaludibacillus neizhouensis TaxID=885475 RepID=A0A3A9K4Q4_9BACI|nr:BglG family transcription antiterminator [Salipaludibacillus neizhouensis]RKL65850.1 PTS sugar transporter [Salipaludibacillus neizhouensis]
MYVSARDRLILELLIQQREGVTVREIANSLHVSERTIHRDLNTFTSLLQPYELVLEKKAGKGVILKGAKEQVDQFNQDLQDANYFDFLPEQRQVLIACKLLESLEPLKLQSLATDLNVTVATVSSDLEKVDAWLLTHGVTTEKRRGLGIQITGTESAKRRAISRILAENFNESDILQYIRRRIPSNDTDVSQSIAGQLLGFINVDKLKVVEEAVKKINQSLPYKIADSAYIALVVHLALAIERITKGERITINKELSSHLKVKKEYTLANDLATELEMKFGLHIPEAEVCYITMHLRGAKFRHDQHISFNEDNLDTAMIAKQLMTHVCKGYDVDLANDNSLYQGLLAHLDPALYRLKQGMHIHNPLQDKIQHNYPKLFDKVKQAFNDVLPHLSIPDEEIGFLVLHFGSAIERDDNRRRHKALVICSSGIGSSKMIASRLQNEFPNIIDVKNISMFELDQKNSEELDLVISTIPLVDHSIDYVQVNPFLTDEDVRKIEDYIERKEHLSSVNEHMGRKITNEKGADMINTAEATTMLTQMHRSLPVTIDLLHHFKVYVNTHKKDMWKSVFDVVLHLKEQGIITNPEEVVDHLKVREEMSGLGIPNTVMALFHARSDHVEKPVFIINDLTNSSRVDSMDGETIEMTRILLMLGPTDMSEEETEVLSSISSMIIDSEESTALFESGTEKEISNHISRKMIVFYQNHLKKES